VARQVSLGAPGRSMEQDPSRDRFHIADRRRDHFIAKILHAGDSKSNDNLLGQKFVEAEREGSHTMPSREITPLSEEELRRFLHSMGPPPVLSTEDPKAFEEFFFNIARPLKNHACLSLFLAWEIAVDTWSNARYARHETVSICRWWDKFHDSHLVAAKTMKLTYEESLRKKAAGLSAYSADAAQVAELQEKIDNTAKDIDAIIARVPTEADFNQALRANADFLHVLDQLRNGANRRRFGNCVLLDKHSAYLDRTTKEAGEVVDAEFKEVQAQTENPPKTETEVPPPAIAASPPIVPTTENENCHDVEP